MQIKINVMEFGKSNRGQTEFDMSFNFFTRINYHLWLCNEASINLDVYSWYQNLKVLERELIGYMKEEEKQEIDQIIKQLLAPVRNTHIQNMKKGRNEMNTKLLYALEEVDKRIRIILKATGMSAKVKQDVNRLI